MGRPLIDLTGKKFGYLTVLELDKTKKSNAKYWKCQCECGTIKSIQGAHLKAAMFQVVVVTNMTN